MTRRLPFLALLLAVALSPSVASAGVWLELLHAPCWTGNKDDVNANSGRYRGSVDCFNEDFNGGGARTVLSIKAYQAWEYGSVFLYYDITGPITSALSTLKDNEKGGFFGGTTVAFSAKKIGERFAGRKFEWGPLVDLSVKYELEHVSKFGSLNYYGLQWDLAVPHMDFVTVTTVVRDDNVFKGIDLQLGGAWQKSFNIASQDFIFDGFFQWGLFGEGEGRGNFASSKGNKFFLAQPQILWDIGKPVGFTPAKIYVGAEYQIAFNRYLIGGKAEHVLQGMVRWNI